MTDVVPCDLCDGKKAKNAEKFGLMDIHASISMVDGRSADGSEFLTKLLHASRYAMSPQFPPRGFVDRLRGKRCSSG